MKNNRTSDTNNGFQLLLKQYLNSTRSAPADLLSKHLDDDLLAAFSDGTLTPRELDPIVEHLANCTFCRQTTAELIRLDFQLNELSPAAIDATPTEPSFVTRFLETVFSGWREVGGQTVFAHSEDETEEDEKKEDPDENPQ